MTIQPKGKQKPSVGNESPNTEVVVDQRKALLKAARTKYLWQKLRETILDTVNASLENDAKERHVTHGVHFNRQIMHRSDIISALFNPTTEEYISIDEHRTIRIFHSSGMKKDVVVLNEDLDRLCYIQHINSFVGWKSSSPHLYLYNSDFEYYSKATAFSEIHHVVYNQSKEEMVVCGVGCLQSYVFRFGNRHIISKRARMEHELISGREIKLVALEDTASQAQKCFIAIDDAVVVFTLANTEFVECKKHLHNREITSLLFFNPLKYLVTGSFDGSIKVWSSDWKLQFVFVGHTHAVRSLAVYPRGSLFLSVSDDKTLRVWSLEIFDQTDKHDLDESCFGLITHLGNKNFSMYSANSLQLWTVDDLHKVHTTIGYEVVSMKCTNHPSFPVRLVAICKDAAVRILTPSSGEVLTTLLLDPKTDKIVDATYAIAEDILFVVLATGEILKCSTVTNPISIIARWQYPELTKWCNYLLVYEYVIGNQSANPWKNIARAFATKHLEKAVDELDASDGEGDGEHDSGRSTPITRSNVAKSQDRTLLLGGRKDGYLCVLNWKTGNIDFEIEGHGSKGVLSMVANSPDDQVVSAGSEMKGHIILSSGHDNVIKIWRLYPYSHQSLSPMMSFYCAQTPLRMCVMTGKLGVAFHEHASATYAVVVYNLGTKSRKDHSPEDDHMDTITALAACKRMKLFASASLDGTVKIWSETNKLIRNLKLNATPHCLEFVDSKGTLLVGIGKNIHRIEATDMLPKVYRFKQITMRFKPVTSEPKIPYDSKILATLDKKQLQRLQNAKPIYRFEKYSDELTPEEKQKIADEEKSKSHAYDRIIERQEDVVKVKDGEIKASVHPPRNKQTRSDAFIRYLALFYDRPEVKLFEEDLFPIDTAKAKANPKPEEEVEHRNYKDDGFFTRAGVPVIRKFADILAEEGFNVEEDKFILESGKDRSRYAADPRGYIPNSVLVRILCPVEREEEIAPDTWRPPRLTDSQLSEIGQTRRENTLADRVLVLSDDEAPPSNDLLLKKAKVPVKKKKGKVSFGIQSEDTFVSSGTDSKEGKEEPLTTKSASFAEPEKPADANPFMKKLSTILTRPATPPLGRSQTLADRRWSLPKQHSSILSLFTPPVSTKSTFTDYSSESTSSFNLVEDQPSGIKHINAHFVDGLYQPSDVNHVSRASSTHEYNELPHEFFKNKYKETLQADLIREYGKACFKKPKPKTPEAIQEPAKKLPPPGPRKPIVKFVAQVPPQRPPPKEPTPPPPKEPTPSPPPPPTPLPEFITQFMGEEWFKQYFPNCSSFTFPKPWTVEHFIVLLLRILKMADYPIKFLVLNAIQQLFYNEGFKNIKDVVEACFDVLNPEFSPPTCIVDNQRSVIKVILCLLKDLGCSSQTYYIELMMQFIDGDQEVRSLVKDTLNSFGLNDKHQFFAKELDSWDTWSIEGANRKLKVFSLCKDWLDKWMNKFKTHVKEGIELLKQGHAIHTKVGRGGETKQKPDKKAYTVTFNEPPSNAVIDKATWIECINYFCEIQLEEEIARLKASQADDKLVDAKNTVLVLPKIKVKPTLVRLGELHTGATVCRPDRETVFNTQYEMRRYRKNANGEWSLPPGQLHGFVPFVKQPMSRVYMNPFPSAIDQYDLFNNEPILITLKTSPKYFIQNDSFPVLLPAA